MMKCSADCPHLTFLAVTCLDVPMSILLLFHQSSEIVLRRERKLLADYQWWDTLRDCIRFLSDASIMPTNTEAKYVRDILYLNRNVCLLSDIIIEL